jgi:hypothetical protein
MMSYYGITKISWDAGHIDRVHLHAVLGGHSNDIQTGPETVAQRHEVIDKIYGGDTVHVIESNGHGGSMLTDKVVTRPGQEGYLQSIDHMGNPSSTLEKLDTF